MSKLDIRHSMTVEELQNRLAEYDPGTLVIVESESRAYMEAVTEVQDRSFRNQVVLVVMRAEEY